MRLQSQAGQTLIEIIIAVGLVVLVLTSISAGVAISVRNNRHAKSMEEAKQYAREGSEWLRRMRDQLGWDSFAQAVRADGASITYCLPALPQTGAAFIALSNQTCTTSQVISGTVFNRSMAVTTSAGAIPDTVTAVISVSWSDGGKQFASQSTLTLRRWR
ncbi:hypothetical protein KBD71_03035 [Candidatus Woesebacteria bacterium]|nr:hypothetical protein [Candidatus Woesebacteria bacterium]